MAHERTLTELHDVSRRLLTAESPQSISDTVAAAAREILDIDVVGVYRFDRVENVLRPECVPDQARELIGEPPTFGPGDGIAWKVFVTGESRIYDDVSRAEAAFNPATPIRSELLIPIGSHGVLICGSTVPGAYDERTAELADILAANAEAAYERMERTRRLRDREAELRAQNRRLEQLDDVNERVRQVTHDLVDATTREEIERVVCDGLAAVEDYDLVWVGERDPIEADVTVRHVAGPRRGYLDSVSFTDGDGAPLEPTARAAQRREPVVVDSVADELRAGTWQGKALSRDYCSVASVPLLHGGIPYGTLTAYASRTGAFDAETRSVLADLGETVAQAIATVEQRRALLSDEQVELVFGLEDLPTVLFELAGSLRGAVEIERVLPESESGSLVYGRADETTDKDFRAACTATGGISDAQVITNGGDGLQFEVRIEGPCVIEPVADHGGTFTRLRLADGRGQLAATFPQSAAVTEFIKAYTDRYPGTELLARREVGVPETGQQVQPLLSDLTDRQREALEVAYEHGFFGWPRETTSEEIAASMNIAGPTFLEHLRRAEGKVVRHVLEGWDRSASPD
ncbi:bacterio-opsin activator domain-containing protein [Halomicroarcula sp. GCM10025817]|uniref:bacterio-opsin activator domain-containing protein n=1 Tax=Haloarcula TaxID=2237 RepID=UPI0023E8D0EF|nr:bacterio-opsin activator domain-containing protein [Halomicroarcula sp. SYNS111]